MHQDSPQNPIPARAIEYAPQIIRFPFVHMVRPEAVIDIAIIMLVLLAFAVWTGLSRLHDALEQMFPVGGMYVWVLLNGLIALGTMSALLLLRGQSSRSIGLTWPSPGVLIVSVIAAVPACYFIGAVLSLSVITLGGEDLMQVARERTGFLAMISNIPLNLVVPVVLFVGFYEEILFRGFILPRLFVLLPGKFWPIACSAVLFGVVHFNQGLPFVAQTAGVGAVLAILVLRTGSLWPAILTHAAIDGISLLIAIKLLPMMEEFLNAATSAPATMPQ